MRFCWGEGWGDSLFPSLNFKSSRFSCWGGSHVPVGIYYNCICAGWRSGESARLIPMWPGFNSRRRRHMWVEFVVGSLPCSKRFSPRTSVFPSPQKPTLPNSNSIWNARTRLNELIWTPMCFVVKQAIYNFNFFFLRISSLLSQISPMFEPFADILSVLCHCFKRAACAKLCFC